MSKLYRRMNASGAASITCGVISIIVGLTTGIILIASGGKLLAAKRHVDL
jgi:hypothetical protein